MRIAIIIISTTVALGGIFTASTAATLVDVAVSPEATYAAIGIGIIEFVIGSLGVLSTATKLR